ncbi:MAG TPA: signal peptidase I [Rugosimonospora sp.]|nr:signal peptidase I [Rugosimonospora sp.]
MPLWQELPLLMIVAFGVAFLIRAFLLQAFFIPSGSMENTLLVGDRVLVNKVVYDVRDPQRGEVVVFRGTGSWAPETGYQPPRSTGTKVAQWFGSLVGVAQPSEKDFIKRIIGLPGDVVACCDDQGRVTVNGVPLDEPYVTDNSPLDMDPAPGRCGPRKFGPITVEPGYMWVMGDHRLISQDSRCQGQVPLANIIGKAFVVVWPQKRWDTLGTPSTFAHIPQPTKAGAAPVSRAPGGAGQSAGVVLLLPLLSALPISVAYRQRHARRRSRLLP